MLLSCASLLAAICMLGRYSTPFNHQRQRSQSTAALPQHLNACMLLTLFSTFLMSAGA